MITMVSINFQTMAATKRNAGLTSVLPRATLNDEELVKIKHEIDGCVTDSRSIHIDALVGIFFFLSVISENACVQEDAAGLDLPDFQHDSAQFPAMDGLFPDLLL
jgi:hypothetical protein